MQEPLPISLLGDDETTALKIPPHSTEAEACALGAVFLDKSAFDKVLQFVQEEDFYRADHRLIFRAINSLNEAGGGTDIVTVAEWLQEHNLLDEAGGMHNLGTIAQNVPSAINVVAYAKIVRNRSVLRQLLSVTSNINDSVFHTAGRTTDQILDAAEQAIFEIAEREVRDLKSYKPTKELLAEALDRIDELFRSKNAITGIPTGYEELDDMTAGLQDSDLIIIAGRPSMGKTALATNIAEHVVITEKKSVAIFSMEMSSQQLAMRMIGSLSRINQQNIRTGRLVDDDWPRLTSTVKMLHDTNLYIDDTPALSPAELRGRCRRLYRDQKGLDLVIVDYLQLMRVPGTKENRTNEITEISRSLKAMAKELNVPVIALSQLNRGLESRADRRPVMSDLRDSGAIEQDADVIAFIYRDEVYNKDSIDLGTAEIIISKQRNGPTGKIKLFFSGEFTRFENFLDDYSTVEDYE